jgi:hypothetical protein
VIFADILRAVDQREHPDDLPPTPYRQVEPPARFVKSVIQMVIGGITLVALVVQLVDGWATGGTIVQAQQQVLELMGLALAASAAVQLAYCLFAPEPGAVIDPLVLGIAAALLFQLAGVRVLDIRDGVAAVLYTAALGGLLAVRRFLTPAYRPGDWTLRDGWRQVLEWRRRSRPVVRRTVTRPRTGEGRHVAAPEPEELTRVGADLEGTGRRANGG